MVQGATASDTLSQDSINRILRGSTWGHGPLRGGGISAAVRGAVTTTKTIANRQSDDNGDTRGARARQGATVRDSGDKERGAGTNVRLQEG
eukprot:5235511-Prymnesium_polylepis.1